MAVRRVDEAVDALRHRVIVQRVEHRHADRIDHRRRVRRDHLVRLAHAEAAQELVALVRLLCNVANQWQLFRLLRDVLGDAGDGRDDLRRDLRGRDLIGQIEEVLFSHVTRCVRFRLRRRDGGCGLGGCCIGRLFVGGFVSHF